MMGSIPTVFLALGRESSRSGSLMGEIVLFLPPVNFPHLKCH